VVFDIGQCRSGRFPPSAARHAAESVAAGSWACGRFTVAPLCVQRALIDCVNAALLVAYASALAAAGVRRRSASVASPSCGGGSHWWRWVLAVVFACRVAAVAGYEAAGFREAFDDIAAADPTSSGARSGSEDGGSGRVSAGGDTGDARRGWWGGATAVARLGRQCGDDNNGTGCEMHSDGEFFPHRLTRGPHCSKRCSGWEE
jgi:hypothetical protein